jgi:hypothetical protein
LIKYIAILLFTNLFCARSFALPDKFEVWFLSVPKVGLLENSRNLYVQNNLQCQPMGDYCFDPQVGLYKKGSESEVQEELDLSIVESQKNYDFMEVPKKMEREMVNCDEASFFDIFCGKSKKKKKLEISELEIWVDTSSTMKQVDFDGFDKKCSRQLFLESLRQTCTSPMKTKFYLFESFRKEAGALDGACINSGLNEMKRIVQDLNVSKAKNVIIITDIFEAQEDFINEIERSGHGSIRGLDKPLYSKDIREELSRIRSFCK